MQREAVAVESVLRLPLFLCQEVNCETLRNQCHYA
jgi:hypothetical protein